jgi:hypothetical protein
MCLYKKAMFTNLKAFIAQASSKIFKGQDKGPVNRNDLVNETFGSNAEKRYKQWKCFFGVQDSGKELPSTKTHPNFKIDPFLFHMQRYHCKHGRWEKLHLVMS